MICGLTVVDDSVVYASGTNYPFPFVDNPPPAVVKTVDGGTTWTAIDMTAQASLLVDIHFTSPTRGWVVGGKANPTVPEGPDGRDNVKPVVLFTEDGGESWVDRVAAMQDQFPFGEWGWKIQFLDENIGYISLENFNDGAILKTSDGGTTWKRLEIIDEQQNANLEGVGFVDENQGWVGGWGTPAFVGGQSSATTDGGKTWTDANEIGKFINRFRFLGSPVAVGYAAGATVYKYSKERAPVPGGTHLAAAREVLTTPFLESDAQTGDDRIVRIPVTVPENAGRLVVNVWERFGRLVAQPLDEPSPAAGSRVIEWDASGLSGNFIVRITVDDESDSEIVMVTPR